MVLRRLTTSLSAISAGLRAQNWTAIAIEFVLVVLGVFLGIVAANWNEERLEKRETRKLLEQLAGEIGNMRTYFESVDEYYASAGGYAERAEAAWSGDPTVGDADFVIAAYQASQITAGGFNSDVWSAIFGAESLRDIEDVRTRQNLARVMTFDYDLINLRAVASRYREEVRKTIPHTIQVAIRERCGDRQVARGMLVLPSQCDVRIPADQAAEAAAALRSRPELASELRWHQAAVANQLAQMDFLTQILEDLSESIGGRSS